VAIYTTDAAGRITYYNQAAADFAGRRPKLGSDDWCVSGQLFWPDGTPMPDAECPMAVTLREGRPIRGQEAVAERPDGTRVSFMPYPTPLFDGAGRLMGAVNLLMDITDQKRAQAEARTTRALLEERDHRTQALADTTDRLKENEETFRLLVQSVTDYAIFMLDPVVFDHQNGLCTPCFAGIQRFQVGFQLYCVFRQSGQVDTNRRALPGLTVDQHMSA
jgi:PAS domain-containing protein